MTRASAARVPAPTMRGALEKTPLAHILVHALEKKLTGTLVLMGKTPGAAPPHGNATPSPSSASMLAARGHSGAIGLANGFVTKVKTSDVAVHLGRVLLELGYVKSEALDASLRSLASARKKSLHGKLLVENGTITLAELRHGLKVQLLQKLAHLFTFPPTATFGFFDSFDLLTDVSTEETAPVDPLPAVWRGVFTHPSWTHVADVLSRVGDTTVRLVSGADVTRFAFDEDEANAIALLRSQPMRAVDLFTCGLVPERTAKLLIYSLFLTRQLVPVDAPSAVASSPSTLPSRPSGVSAWNGVTPPMGTLPPSGPLPRGSVQPSAPSARNLVAAASVPSMPSVPVAPSRAPPARGSIRPSVVPSEPVDHFRRAEAALADRDFREAEGLCRRGLEANPKDLRFAALAAFVEARKPETPTSMPLADCIAALDDVIGQDGTCERAFYYRAVLHKQNKRDAFAARDFRRAAELDPDNAEAVREMMAHERRMRMP